MREFEGVLNDYGLYQFVKHNKTDRTYKVGGRTVEFFGADDPQKLRGYKANILYCNEANELNHDKEFLQLRMRTSGPIFLDFNPSDPYVWLKTELEDKRALKKGDVETIVSTYKDNPLLSTAQIEEVEYLKETDKALWAVYGLGDYGKVEGLIIESMTIIDQFPDLELRRRAAGLDFGFTNSKTALADCAFIAPNKIYIDVPIYASGLTDRRLKETLEGVGWPRTREVYADSAQPQSIEELRSGGFNVRPVKKFRDSLSVGISKMRELDWYVTGRSQGLIKEQKLWKWKQDQAGNWLNEPIDGFDHAMDAVRYYCLSKLTGPRGKAHKRKLRTIR